AVGRERRESAQEADHDRHARRGGDHGAAVQGRGDGADRQAAREIDRTRLPRKRAAGRARDPAAERVAAESAERAAQRESDPAAQAEDRRGHEPASGGGWFATEGWFAT